MRLVFQKDETSVTITFAGKPTHYSKWRRKVSEPQTKQNKRQEEDEGEE